MLSDAMLTKAPNKGLLIGRYLKFINSCLVKNSLTELGYIESHHILPRSIFPEFSNLSVNNWNRADLSARQHIIAHMMLSRIFGGSMIAALWVMVNCNGVKVNSRMYEKSKVEWSTYLKEYAQTDEGKIDYANRGKSTHKTKLENNIYKLAGEKLSVTLNTLNEKTGLTFGQERALKVDRDIYRENLGCSIKEYMSKFMTENNPVNIEGVPEKISKSLKQYYSVNDNPFKGKTHTDETKNKQSLAKIGDNNSTTNTVWVNNGETQLRVNESEIPNGFTIGRLTMNRTKVFEEKICPHCGKSGKGGNMVRYHFDNCKKGAFQ